MEWHVCMPPDDGNTAGHDGISEAHDSHSAVSL